MKITIEFDNYDVMDQDDIMVFGRFDNESLDDDDMNPYPRIVHKRSKTVIPLKTDKNDVREEKKIRQEDEHIRNLCEMTDDDFSKYLQKLHSIREWRKIRLEQGE